MCRPAFVGSGRASYSSVLLLVVISAPVSNRIDTFRTAPVLSQLANPRGLAGARLDARAQAVLLVVEDNQLLVIDRAANHVARDPDPELVPRVVLVFDQKRFVSFSEASEPSRLERPVTLPPQPPLTNVRNDLPMGNVVAAKKSRPSTRFAS